MDILFTFKKKMFAVVYICDTVSKSAAGEGSLAAGDIFGSKRMPFSMTSCFCLLSLRKQGKFPGLFCLSILEQKP